MRGLTLGDPALVASAAGFSPLSLSPALWFDASDISTITESSGAVSQWNDKSGNGRHATQATSSAQPTTGLASQNGRNLLRFDGNDALALGTSLSVPVTYTTFIVYSNTNVGTSAVGQSLLSSQTSSPQWMIQKGGAGQYQDVAAGYNDTLLLDTSAKKLNVSRRATGPAGTLRSNGVSYAASGTTSNTFNVYYIGRRYDGNYLKCDLCEILFFTTALIDTDVAKVESYLNTKWAVY